jgi:nucleoside 2-deoxyribosyltransferase
MEDNSSKCPVCNENAKGNGLNHDQGGPVSCARCGDFSISRKAIANIRNAYLTERQRANISGWLRENRDFHITDKNLEWLERLPTPSFHSRADMVLMNFEKQTEYAGQLIELTVYEFIRKVWCLNANELDEILGYLCSIGRLSIEDGSRSLSKPYCCSRFKIGPDGWAHLEKLKSINADMQQGFVAMWFDPSMARVYEEAIDPGIDGAGYKPFKIDQKEHTGKIDDEIIAQIRRSRFVVADFTGHRGGVYFEAGFARGLGIEVIWTCREDHLNDIHFDIRQYNCIVWEENNLEKFRKRLQYRIESVLGRYDRQLPENPH